MNEVELTPVGVYNPSPTIRIDGVESTRLSSLILTMEVREGEGGLNRLELRLSNVASVEGGSAELAFENEQDIALGNAIAVYAGDVVEPQEIFRGVVSGLEAQFPRAAPPELVVFAEDVLQSLRLARRTHAYLDVSLSDLVETVASRHGLNTDIDGLTDSIGNWMQLNESDLAFLRRVLRRYDVDMQVVGTQLQVGARQDVRRGEVTLQMYSQLLEANFTVDLAEQVTAVTTSGWDPSRGERIDGRAEQRRPLPGPLGGAGRTGAEVLAETFGERAEHIGHVAVTNRDEAQALAEVTFDQRARRFVRIQGCAEGNPGLRVGTHVNIDGASPRFDSVYYVVDACHHYDVSSGFETHFCAESYALGDVSGGGR